MANVGILNMPVAASLSGEEWIPGVQGGSNVRFQAGLLLETPGSVQEANTVFAGPASGPAAAPTFRGLVADDIPNGLPAGGATGQILAKSSNGDYDAEWIASGAVTSVGLALPASVFSVSGSPVTTAGTLDGSFVNQSANTVFAGPALGAAAVPAFRALVADDMSVGSITQAWDANLDQIASLLETRGDLITGGISAWQRLALGASDTFLGSDGTDAAWRTAAQVKTSLGYPTVTVDNAVPTFDGVNGALQSPASASMTTSCRARRLPQPVP